MSLNRVILTGRLTRDPEFRASQSGVGVAKISMAVDSFYKGEKKTSFIDLTAFGKNAELLRDYFKKGSSIGIDGTLHQESWEKDGEKRSKLVVYIDRIEFMGGKKSEEEGNDYSNPPKRGKTEKNDFSDHEGSDFNSDSDLPF